MVDRREFKRTAVFPVKVAGEWLLRRSFEAPVYAFAKTGVEPLRAADQMLFERHSFDLVILVDGGTDSLIFGDEPGLDTVVEDAVSVVAPCEVAGDRTLLAVLGFGVDHFHGVSHHSFLENVARLSRTSGNLGVISLVQRTPEGDAFLDLVGYANQRQPQHRRGIMEQIPLGTAKDARPSGADLFLSTAGESSIRVFPRSRGGDGSHPRVPGRSGYRRSLGRNPCSPPL